MEKRVLFVCSQNMLRSPTAEKIFSEYGNLVVASAGVGIDAEIKLNNDYVSGSDLIFVMEEDQREILLKKFKKYLNNVKVVCLDIPDQYDFMDPELIRILWEKVPPHIKELVNS